MTENMSNDVAVPVSYRDVEDFLDSVPLEPELSETSSNKDKYSKRMGALVKRLVDSYANVLDVLLTLTDPGASARAPTSPSAQSTSSGAGQLTQADIPKLFDFWAKLFWRIIEGLLAERLPLGDNFIVFLRLSKRSGRFGEVPRRPERGAIKAEPEDIPWPGHPSVRTKAWMLEPIQDVTTGSTSPEFTYRDSPPYRFGPEGSESVGTCTR